MADKGYKSNKEAKKPKKNTKKGKKAPFMVNC